MKLIAELDVVEYERTQRSDRSVLVDALTEIEVRQADGLLSFTRRIVGLEALSGEVSHTLGLPRGPAIRVFVTQEK